MKRNFAAGEPSKLWAWLVFFLIVLFCMAAVGHLASSDIPLLLGGF